MPYETDDRFETEWDERYREMRRKPRRRRKRAAGTGENEPSKQQGGHLLLAVQVISCAVVLAAALVLRLLGGEWYHTVQAWYWDHLNSSIVAQEDWDEVETRFLDLIPEAEQGEEASSSLEQAE